MNVSDVVKSPVLHPGEILKEELKQKGIGQVEFAEKAGIPKNELNQIFKAKRSITSDVALLIGMALLGDADIWMQRQQEYDAQFK